MFILKGVSLHGFISAIKCAPGSVSKPGSNSIFFPATKLIVSLLAVIITFPVGCKRSILSPALI